MSRKLAMVMFALALGVLVIIATVGSLSRLGRLHPLNQPLDNNLVKMPRR